MNPEPAIRVVDVVKRYGGFEAVTGISFSVAPGEIFGLLGPNGAGKSTLIRMLTTLIPITSGQVRINGHDVAAVPDAVRRSIGVLPQAMTSDLDLTVEENLLIYAQLYQVDPVLRQQRIDTLLEAVELSDRRHAMTRSLSGGMRRRLEIARGLIHNPKVFFMDEPTSGLDPVSRVRVWDLLKRLNADYGITLLITTHYMDEADFLCDRVAIVDHGRLVTLDTPRALKDSLPGGTVIEARFGPVPQAWQAALQGLREVASAEPDAAGGFLLHTRNGSATLTDLVTLAAGSRVDLKAISVQPTSLDDVFVHYAGRNLDDPPSQPNPAGAGLGKGGRS